MKGLYETGLVYTNDKCIGCNKCIRACSCIGANISTEPNEEGKSRIEVDGSRCVACGACFDTCEHEARVFRDDTERFFADLAKGEQISLLIAPSFIANYPEEYGTILGGLKRLGINRLISVSFGADITTWGYIKYIQTHDFTGGISQPCPAVVRYIEQYIPEFLPKLFPVQSPLMCAAIYARNELGITDKLAFLSPCIAKKMEIEDPNNHGYVSYNVTFDHLMKYAKTHDIKGEPCTDEIEYGLGSVYPMPGGLKENVYWLLGSDVFIRQIEGEKRMYHFLEKNKGRIEQGKTPFLFIDALNCENGCICGTGTDMRISSTDDALYHLHDIEEKVKQNEGYSAWAGNALTTPEERLAAMNQQFANLKLEDYLRKYTDRSAERAMELPDEEELEAIFLEMDKKDEASRHINCSCCGYDTCKDMAIAIFNGFNHKDNCIHYLKDMVELKATRTDVMTGLPNEMGVRCFITQHRAAGTLIKYNAFSLNLKHFGLINKRYGKRIADRLLIRYAEVLAGLAGQEECVGRISGDNFALILFKEKMEEFLKLLDGVEIHIMIDGETTPVTIQAAAGCLEITDPKLDSEAVLGMCNAALNRTKNQLRAPYVFSTLELENSILEQKQIAEIFPGALARGEFQTYYQPKVNTDNNTLVGAEALVRWVRDGEVISPGKFIPVLEMDESICKLDFYVFEQVCQDIRNWMDTGIEPVRVSTNFSRKNLSLPDFSERISKILHHYEIPKKYIEVELTETLSEEENDRLSNFIRDMHDANIVMAIDDFGTGYSSLNLLRDFPADVLKLDKSFVDKHTNSKRDSIVVANIAKMAKELDMSVITEGVEQWDQVDFLKSINVNLVQGYLFDKPLTKEDFEERLKDKIYKNVHIPSEE
ncbi:MAG: EAL domain-containing protein, partial [Lachnospiraceae bacterium]|nr:EAL domain-containing protein [Lachnospiraceae bacterium]